MPQFTFSFSPHSWLFPFRTVLCLSDVLDEQLKALWFSPFQSDEMETEVDMVRRVFAGTINIFVTEIHRAIGEQRKQFMAGFKVTNFCIFIMESINLVESGLLINYKSINCSSCYV